MQPEGPDERAGCCCVVPLRIYQAVPENLPLFHDFFHRYLLPVQLRHGARLAGRWETEDSRVIAIWEYDDRAAYERINAAARADPASRLARDRRGLLPALVTSTDETFMSSTISSTIDWPGRRLTGRADD